MSRTIRSRPGRANLLLALTLALISGCGKYPTASVSGTVTYGGKPIEGTIVFTPSGNSTERLATEAPIREGRYEMPTVSAGTKSVDVYMTEAASDPTKSKEKSAIPPPALLVPKPRTVEVQPGSQTMDFSLTR